MEGGKPVRMDQVKHHSEGGPEAEAFPNADRPQAEVDQRQAHRTQNDQVPGSKPQSHQEAGDAAAQKSPVGSSHKRAHLSDRIPLVPTGWETLR